MRTSDSMGGRSFLDRIHSEEKWFYRESGRVRKLSNGIFFFFFFDLLWKDSERKSNGWSKENVGKIVTLCNVRHRLHL